MTLDQWQSIFGTDEPAELPPEPTDHQWSLIADLRKGQDWLTAWHDTHGFDADATNYLDILDQWCAKELGLQNLFDWKLCIWHPQRCPPASVVSCDICVQEALHNQADHGDERGGSIAEI